MYKRAPLQRKVVREQIMMLGKNTATTIDYVDYGFGEEVPQSYTVLRAPLDEWFAAEAETAGAMVASGIWWTNCWKKDGKIVGIKAGEDEMLGRRRHRSRRRELATRPKGRTFPGHQGPGGGGRDQGSD